MFDSINSIALIVWAMFFGITIAVIAVYSQKKTTGGFISALIDKEAFDESSAKTLDELNIASHGKKMSILRALKSQFGLNRAVGAVFKGGVKAPGEQPTEVYNEATRFFIDSEKAAEAKKKYASDKSNPALIAVLIIALAVVAALSETVISGLTEFSENTFGSFFTSESSKKAVYSDGAEQTSENNSEITDGEKQSDNFEVDEAETKADVSDSETESNQSSVGQGEEGNDTETSGESDVKKSPTIPKPSAN